MIKENKQDCNVGLKLQGYRNETAEGKDINRRMR